MIKKKLKILIKARIITSDRSIITSFFLAVKSIQIVSNVKIYAMMLYKYMYA